jgi:hypothetical protein
VSSAIQSVRRPLSSRGRACGYSRKTLTTRTFRLGALMVRQVLPGARAFDLSFRHSCHDPRDEPALLDGTGLLPFDMQRVRVSASRPLSAPIKTLGVRRARFEQLRTQQATAARGLVLSARPCSHPAGGARGEVSGAAGRAAQWRAYAAPPKIGDRRRGHFRPLLSRRV